LLRQRLGQIAEGRFLGLRPERVKFEDLAKDFLNDYRINGKRSLDKAERSVRHWQRFFGGMQAVDITTDKPRMCISDRQDEGTSNAEVNREMAAPKRLFNLALQQTPPKVPQKPYIPMLQEHNIKRAFSSLMSVLPCTQHYHARCARSSHLPTIPDAESGKCWG
jgi:hypothetical protein